MHYYKRNLGDYAKKAGRLSMLQHGSYTLLIDACYDRETFPTLEEAIEWTWASSTAEIEAVQFVLRKFFELKDGVYVQKRIQEELDEYKAKSEKNTRIAKDRETKRKEKGTERVHGVDDSPPLEHESPPNHKPITNNHKPDISSSLRSEDSAAQKQRTSSRPKREEVTLAKYLETCKAAGIKPVPDDHYIREWCVEAHIPVEMLQVAWVVFREKYLGDEKLKGKRYKDWPGHFATSVKDRWYGLWFIGDDGKPAWTSTGQTRKQVLEVQQNKTQKDLEHEPA